VEGREGSRDEVLVLLKIVGCAVEVLLRDFVNVWKLASCLISGHDAIDIAFVLEGLFCTTRTLEVNL